MEHSKFFQNWTPERLNHKNPPKESVLRINAKKTLYAFFLGGGIEGWEEGGRNTFNSYPDSMKKPLSLGEGEWGEVEGEGKKDKKSLFCSISESLNIYVWIS